MTISTDALFLWQAPGSRSLQGRRLLVKVIKANGLGDKDFGNEPGTLPFLCLCFCFPASSSSIFISDLVRFRSQLRVFVIVQGVPIHIAL
jgi:hypothetical protein